MSQTGTAISMPKQVCCRNFVNLFTYLENVQGLVDGISGHDLIPRIIQGYVNNQEYVIQDPKAPDRTIMVQELHLRDKRCWVGFDYYLSILSRAEQLLGGCRPLYQAGTYAGYLIMESIQLKYLQILRIMSLKIIFLLSGYITQKFVLYGSLKRISYRSGKMVVARNYEAKYKNRLSSLCDWQAGIYAGIATYLGGYDVKVATKEYAAKEKIEIVFSIHWLHASFFRKFCIFLHSFVDPEYIRERDLDNLLLHDMVSRQDTLIKIKTAKQLEIQAKLAEADKKILEQRITGGFAHEMRNAITGAQLDIRSILHYQNGKQSATRILQETFVDMLKVLDHFCAQYSIPKKAMADKMIPRIKRVSAITEDLEIAVDGVQEDLHRSLGIIHQIHQYAKLAELKTGNDHINLEGLINEIVFKQKNEFEKADIVFSIQNNVSAYVRADKLHMNSVFVNLIINAKEALIDKPKGSREITVNLNRIQNRQKEGVVVEISDNGPGMDQDTLKEIFEPFFSTKLPTGTGLGLGITKKIVQIYGGEIKVDSSLGKGTTFTVVLPDTFDKKHVPETLKRRI